MPPQPPLTVAALRADQGLTRNQLAARAGVSPTFLQSVEQGYLPKRGAGLDKIAAALGVTADALRAAAA